MALSHDSYSFEGARHGVIEFGPLDTPLIVVGFSGVYGVSVIADDHKAQPISCRAWIEGFETLQGLQNAIDEIHLRQGKLTGTLTVSGPAAQQIQRCTFAAFEPERPFFDGSGVHGWVCRGRLTWLRRG